MAFIGILTEHKNETYLKRQLENIEWNNVYFLSEKTIDNMRNIKFETFLIGKKIDKKQDTIRDIIQNSKYIIMNSDIKENLSVIENLDLTLITYGYNSKATITTSSLEENKVMVCLQRNIKNIYQNEVEPQEIQIEGLNDNNDYGPLEFASLIFLYR